MGTKTKSFTSAMTGAPVLSGSAGALIGVLDAVLVNGFGLQSVSTLVIAGGVATATVASTPSAVVGSVILVAGATPTSLNGEQRVTAITANSVSFTTTEANATATGTITLKVAAAGWSKLYSGTNLAAYKIICVTGTGCILRVDDTGTTTARVRGYESMTDVSTGTGLFPSLAQWAAPGLWWSKSNAASAAARPWRIVADDRGVYFFPKNSDTGGEHQGNYFGDILSLRSNDPYACVLRANSTDKSASVAGIGDSLEFCDPTQSQTGLYIARAANSLGSAIQQYHTQTMYVGMTLTQASGSSGLTYPSTIDNGLMLSQLMCYAYSGIRGYFPGIRLSNQLTNYSFATGDNISGSGDMAGKTVTVIKLGGPSANYAQGVVFMDQVSDWR